MSIRAAIKRHVHGGRLFPLKMMLDSDKPQRGMFLSAEVKALLEGPWTSLQCTGIHEYGNSSSVILYPNPFTDQSTLVITDALGFNKADLEIYDVVGQSIRSIVIEIHERRTEIPIDRSGMSAGIYFYKVYGENNDGSKMVIGTGKMVVE